MSYVPMQSKLIGETLEMGFDFQNQMIFGETLDPPLVASVTVTLFSGLDNSPSSILTGPVTVSGTTVNTKVTAGMAGVIYILTFHAAGSSGAVYRGTRYLAILSNDGSFVPSSIPTLTGDLPDGVVGAAYSHNLTIAGGYLPYATATPTGSAPEWMGYTVVDNTLVCAGTSSSDALASYSFNARIQDAALTFATSAQVINLTRTTVAGDLGDMAVGATPSFSYTASLGTAPYTFVLVGGALPTGLSLNSNGSISGTTTTDGSFSWTVRGTDVNNISDDHADSANVTTVDVYVATDNTMAVTRSINGGVSFTEAITTGLLPTTSSVSISSAGGILYHLGASGSGRYSASGDSGSFASVTGLTSTPGAGMMFKFGSEWQLYNGAATIWVSSDGTAFTPRTITGGVANTVAKPVSDGGSNILAIGSGHRLMISSNTGATFFEYTNAALDTIDGTQFLLHIPGVGYRLFGLNPSLLQVIGSSVTAANAAAWSYVAAPEQAALTANIHGVARNPTTGRIVMVLRNGHTWYSDDNTTSWQAGPNFTYGSPLNFGPAPGNAFSYINGYYYFCTTQGAGVTDVQRIPEDMSAWATVHSVGGGNAINTICGHP